MRTYTQLLQLDRFHDRYDYLKLGGIVGETTFGNERMLNQQFYHSFEWRDVRSFVIARDLGFDLASPEFPVRGNPIIHHMNPLTKADIIDGSDNLLNPEYLITTSHRTHNAIHYGDESLLPYVHFERTPNDTAPWKQ